MRTFAQRGGAGVISLQHGDGAVLLECDGATSLFTNIGGISIRSTPAGLIFLCWDDDPHFDLVLPYDVLARLQSNACLVVELTPSALLEACAKVLRLDVRLMADFRGAANAGGAAQSCVPDLSTDIENVAALLKRKLSRRDQTIAEQSIQLAAMRDELLRAEAQLELLKDLWLAHE